MKLLLKNIVTENMDENGMVKSIVNDLGLSRNNGVLFKDAGFTGQIKDILCIMGGMEMAIFGIKFPLVNGGAVAVIYLYHTLLRWIEGISSFLMERSNETANSIGNALANNSMYKIGAVVFIGIISAFVVISLFKFFFRAFIFIASVFVFVQGPGKSILLELGITSEIPAILIGVLCGLFLMFYLEKMVRKSILILLFSVVGCALIFLGIGEAFDLDNSIGKSILTLDPISGDFSYVLKEYFLFWCTVVVSILTQIFITR